MSSRSRTEESEILEEIQERFASFNLPIVDPWRKVDDVRLIAMPSGYALREDGIGRLHTCQRSDCLVGRDELRVARIIQSEAKRQSSILAERMRVARDMLFGKKRMIESATATRRICTVRWSFSGRLAMPPLFVSYQTRMGNIKFRLVVLMESQQEVVS